MVESRIPGANSGSVSSPNKTIKASKVRSPKVTECKALKRPMSERLALQEAEEAKNEVSIMSAKLEESERQLMEISASEDDRAEGLCKISKDRDRAWQSELEAVQKQHSMDSASLVSAMNKIQKLKVQLEKHAESAHAEIQNMKIELTETLSLVKKLKSELTDCRESEARGLELVSKTRMQLEVANKTIENLRSNATKETEAYNMLLLELEQSKCKVKSLEGLVSKLQVELVEIKRVKTELNFAKLEISQLRLALDEAEVRYQKEYIKSILQIRSAYEQVECIKTELSQKKAKLEAELTRTKANVEELRQKTKKLEFDLKELKDNLTVKETELNTITEQNKMLKREIESKMKSDESVVVSLEASKASEQAALMRLESAQAANTEMEAELKILKVQANQWRKVAKAATAMLSNNGRYSDKTIPFDITIGPPKWERIDDDDGNDLSKKKNNMLRKIGVLWKKGQK
ncbi:hypothetical protein ES332_D08G069300v1 [Gossypium tomentosum]|uniref:Uncharacterized protein n=1 Tax=Gossypium tomentosum TaxID=34277 RepID=A0A5D2JRK2_GOSTO|nr:hypothetical protein ES332_D08G069300v1 [Gossypium tomentosum]